MKFLARHPRLLVLAGAVAAFACGGHDFMPRTQQGEIDIYDDLFSVSVADEQHAVAVGYHGSIYWTENGGDTWKKGVAPTEELLYSVSMSDATHGWAVGQTGTILNGGDFGPPPFDTSQSIDRGDTTITGVSVAQEMSCYAADPDLTGDDLVGYKGLTRITQVNPGKFQLVMHESQTEANAAQGIKTSTIDLETPPSMTRIASWASIVE